VASWSQLLPASEGPPPVEAARRKVAELRERIPAQREAVAAAERAVVESEVADRERMARELREGGSPTADSHAVEKAQQHAASERRTGEALMLAVQGSEDQLGEVVREREQRDRWLRDARRREATARRRASKLVGELRGALTDVATERQTIFWLQHGLDRQQRAGGGAALELAGSERKTANNAPLGIGEVLDMMAATVEPEPEPEPQAPPAEPVHAETR
jgi:hypothetical protein